MNMSTLLFHWLFEKLYIKCSVMGNSTVDLKSVVNSFTKNSEMLIKQ